MDFVDIARRSSARGLQLRYPASRGFVSDSWAFLFQPISYGVVLLVFGLTSLGPGTQSLGLCHGIKHLSLDNKCDMELLHGGLGLLEEDLFGLVEQIFCGSVAVSVRQC